VCVATAGTALRGGERMYDPILLLFDDGGEEKRELNPIG
jgi:hypothetical protein